MAIKDSLRTLHLSVARTVGDGSYGQRKGGLAGLCLDDAGFSAHQRQTTHEAALSCQMEVASGLL